MGKINISKNSIKIKILQFLDHLKHDQSKCNSDSDSEGTKTRRKEKNTSPKIVK